MSAVARLPRQLEVLKADDRLINVEAEAAVLGGLWIDNRLIDRAMDILRPEDFAEPLHGRLYAATIRERVNGRSVTPVTLAPEFRADPDIADVGGTGYFATLTEQSAAALVALDFAAQIADFSRRRTLRAELVATIASVEDCQDHLSTSASNVEAALWAATEKRSAVREMTGADTINLVLARQAEIKKTGLNPGALCRNIIDLNRIIGGLERGHLVIAAGRPGMGKAQPLDAKVLTPTGWLTMGEIAVGQDLASPDGRPSKVLAVHPQGEREVFRFTLSDGRSTECCAEHLWRVFHRKWAQPRVLQTSAIATLLCDPNNKNRLWLDEFHGEFGVDGDLPINPWLLGALLGNGTFGGTPRFSSNDPDTLDRIRCLLGSERVVHAGKFDWRLNDGGQIRRSLEDLGLADTVSATKFVPKQYMQASTAVRRAVLQGLMDTDGWAEEHGTVRYCTVSQRLAQDVCELVRSLGGLCSIVTKEPFYTYKGERRQGQLAYICRIRHRDAEGLFTLKRKAERARRKGSICRLNIASIKLSRVAQTQCLMVSHPDHLYVTDDFIVTHNTALATSAAWGYAANGHGVGFVSLEMGDVDIGMRLASDVCFSINRPVPHEAIRRGELSFDQIESVERARDKLAEMPIIFVDAAAMTLSRLSAMVRRMRRRMEAVGKTLDVVFVDYLQLLTMDGKQENRTQEVSAISRGLKAIAKDNDITMFVLSQLNRGVEARENKRPLLSDLRESGQIEQDADAVIFLYRDEYYLKQAEPDSDNVAARERWHLAMNASHGRIEFIAGKTRHSETSKAIGFFFGQHQAVRGSDFYQNDGFR